MIDKTVKAGSTPIAFSLMKSFFIDEELEMVQEESHQYFLTSLGDELRQASLKQKMDNLQGAMNCRESADAHKSLLQKYFA